MRYGELTETGTPCTSIKHCFTCVLTAQWGMGWELEAINPAMKTQIQKQTETSSHTRGTLKDNGGTAGPKKYPKFHENTELVRKSNSGTNRCTTKTAPCEPGRCSRWLPGWCGPPDTAAAGAGLGHTNSSARSRKVPGLFYGNN